MTTRTISTFNKNALLPALAAVAVALTVSCGKEETGPAEFSGKVETLESADLGLSVIWSSYNLGSEGTGTTGAYYAWGESSEKDSYLSDGYTIPVSRTWTDDPAALMWGGTWRIPTSAELQELCDPEKCSVTYARYKGKTGWVVTSKVSGYEGKSIFFPAAGYKAGDHVNYPETQGVYWSSELTEEGASHAANLFFEGNGAYMNIPPKGAGGTLWCGYQIRPVRNR